MGHAWRVFVWCLGVLLLLLSVLTAFVGYVLPWGQMSFWGATVITSLASALPVVGNPLVSWLWGGLSVENATLNRLLTSIGAYAIFLLVVLLGELVMRVCWLSRSSWRPRWPRVPACCLSMRLGVVALR